jgi:hypothetical protein
MQLLCISFYIHVARAGVGDAFLADGFALPLFELANMQPRGEKDR